MTTNKIYVNSFGTQFQIKAVQGTQALVQTLNTPESYEAWVPRRNVIRQSLKTPVCRSVFGVGYLGTGPYIATYFDPTIGKHRQSGEYLKWVSMLKRCYDPGYQSRQPTYHGVVVCKEWHNFQTFAAWCHTQKGFGLVGFELDKDLTFSGLSEYSPENCSFVPKHLNSVMASRGKTGKYLEGVEKNSKGCKFFAHLGIDGNRVRVGTAFSEEEAYGLFRTAKTNYIRRLAEENRELLEIKTYEFLSKYSAPSFAEAMAEWQRLNGSRGHVLSTPKDLQ